jgi:hypothetical protein
MSRTFILASIAAVLIALTGTTDQASAGAKDGAMKWLAREMRPARHWVGEVIRDKMEHPRMRPPRHLMRKANEYLGSRNNDDEQ